MQTFEINFDGLIGPTHNYGGLAFGNMASMQSAAAISNPREAALQGLNKMRLLMRLGIKQAVLPPHYRPNISFLRSLGFKGTDIEILKTCIEQAPELFSACYSASNMWVANSSTVSPSFDTQDKRLHFTISNLQSHSHRAQEASFTLAVFKKIFANDKYFVVHPPLLSTPALGDEGAANHNRFCLEYGTQAINIFVFGKQGFSKDKISPKLFPARQTKEAQQAIARLHGLNPNKTFFIQQNPAVIDKGVFHNDVIAVVNQNVLLYHEHAFLDKDNFLEQIKKFIDFPLYTICIKNSDLSVEDAVTSYLFNSQIVSLKTGGMALIAPIESRENKAALQVLNKIKQDNNPIKQIEFVDCRQSMKNGGGPACLRLRVVMTEEELQYCHPGIFLTENLSQSLEHWILKHYRERLTKEELLDPSLLIESQTALDELTTLLNLGSIYPFQKT